MSDITRSHDAVHGSSAEPPEGDHTHDVVPGLVHTPRRTDIDPRAAKNVERQVLALFLVSVLGTLVFLVGFFAFKLGGEDYQRNTLLSNLVLGGGLGVALFFIGAAIIHWARKLMAGEEVVQERHVLRSTEEERAALVADFQRGVADAGLPRRKVLLGGLVAAVAPLLLPLVVLLRDLGPLPRRTLRSTVWDSDVRILNDVTNRPLRAEDIPVGGFVSAIPETLLDVHHENAEQLNARGKAAVMLMRLQPDEIVAQQGDNWDHEGIVCYSKICTHVGCPLGLYEQQTHHMLCPCHQSTFDISDAGKVVFGPAARSLPQLAITVNADGYLVARGDFTEPVGPSFWERGAS